MSTIKLITLDLDNTLWDVDSIIVKAEALVSGIALICNPISPRKRPETGLSNIPFVGIEKSLNQGRLFPPSSPMNRR